MRTMKRREGTERLAVVVVIAAIFLAAVPAFSQSSNVAWSGQVQCQLNDEDQTFARQETQTWALVGGPPVSPTGIPTYNATWSVTGQGQLQRVQGAQTTNIQWSTNVPPQPTTISIFIRASDNRLIVLPRHSQFRVDNATSGVRQIIVNGVAQQPTNLGHAVWEWQFPHIEASPTDNVTGSIQSQADAGDAELLHRYGGPPPSATCQWQFTKGDASPSAQLAPASATANTPLASTLKPTGGVISAGVLPPAPAPPSPDSPSISAAVANSAASSAVLKVPVQALQPVSQLVSKLQIQLKPPAAPTGFTANDAGSGAVQLKWQTVSGAQQYRLAGSGLASSGLYVAGTSNNVTVQQVPPGMDQWQIASVGLNNSWDPKQTASASTIVRYPPSHSPPWLSKANGAGNPALALGHYLSLCNQCLPGANFKDVMQNLGLPLDTLAPNPPPTSGCGDTPWCGGWGSAWTDDQAARYTNVTEFENSARVTGCWIIGRPNGRIICYTRTIDHGLQVIVRQTDASWYLSFTASDPTAEVFDWVTYDGEQLYRTPFGQRLVSSYTLTDAVSLDSEGAKFPPHTCLACHGGQVGAHGVTGSTLLPLDPGLLQNFDTTNSRKLNIAVLDSSPSAAVAKHLTGIYGTDPHIASSTGDPNYVPPSWTGEPATYKSLVKPYCVTCHLATPSNLDFTIRGNFYGNKELVYTTVCEAHSMPHAEAPYVTLWSKDTGIVFLPGYLAGILGHDSCP